MIGKIIANILFTRITYRQFVVVSVRLGVPKECDLVKNPLSSSIHSANSFGHLTQPGSNNSGSSGGDSNGRLHVSSGLCDPHNMHQDQVGDSVG